MSVSSFYTDRCLSLQLIPAVKCYSRL